MKTEVCTWRVSADLKDRLEQEARRRKTSVSAVLDLAARDWLKTSLKDAADEDVQLQLHQAVSKHLGAFAGGNPDRSRNAKRIIRQRLKGRRDR
jgi:hypothetical protein